MKYLFDSKDSKEMVEGLSSIGNSSLDILLPKLPKQIQIIPLNHWYQGLLNGC
jgi:hypothetical protein